MPERSPVDEIKRSLRLLLVTTVALLLIVGLSGGWLIQRSAQRDADKLYAESVAACQRVNLVRTELNQLYSAFETHNTITAQLFEVVGERLNASDPKVARAFTTFAVQYRAIQHEYDNIERINCRRVIEEP